MALMNGTVPRGHAADLGDPAGFVVIPLPPQNGGGFGWGPGYLSFGADFQDAKLRVAVWNDTGAYWRVEELTVKVNGGRVHIILQDGDSKVSVGRKKLNAADTGQQPVGWLYEIILKA